MREKYFGSCVIDDFLCAQVAFVADEELINVLTSVTINFLKPLFNIVERLLVSAVIHYNNAMSTTVVAGSDSSKSLLASRIPLQHNV